MRYVFATSKPLATH